MAQIKDLEVKQGNVDIVIEVTEKGEVREFQKFGRSGKVCTATAKDETGEIKLTLWNEDVDKVNVGDKLQLTNGYVNEFQGEKQLTTGKFGKMEVVGASEGEAAPAPADETTPKPEPVEEAPAEETPSEAEPAEETPTEEPAKEPAAEPEKTSEESVEEEKVE